MQSTTTCLLHLEHLQPAKAAPCVHVFIPRHSHPKQHSQLLLPIHLPHTPSLCLKPCPTQTSPLSAITTHSHPITHQGIDDLLGGLDLGPSQPTGPPPPLPVVLADTARGVTVGARLIRHNNGIGYHISITNSSQGGCEGGVSQAASHPSCWDWDLGVFFWLM